RPGERVLGRQAGGQLVEERRRVRRRGGVLQVDELAGDLRAEQRVERLQELLAQARQIAAVDVGLGRGGDDVHLVAGVQHGRVGRVADLALEQLAERAEPG